MSLDKEYIGTITLGIKTDTFDITGKVLDKKDVNVSKDDIEKVQKNIEDLIIYYNIKKINLNIQDIDFIFKAEKLKK